MRVDETLRCDWGSPLPAPEAVRRRSEDECQRRPASAFPLGSAAAEPSLGVTSPASHGAWRVILKSSGFSSSHFNEVCTLRPKKVFVRIIVFTIGPATRHCNRLALPSRI